MKCQYIYETKISILFSQAHRIENGIVSDKSIVSCTERENLHSFYYYQMAAASSVIFCGAVSGEEAKTIYLRRRPQFAPFICLKIR